MYRYNEDKILSELIDYVSKTYDQHYVVKPGSQVIDIWEASGSLETTARDTAIKYLMRYGKKDGKNKKDLLKAIHYIILMLYVHGKEVEEVCNTESFQGFPNTSAWIGSGGIALCNTDISSIGRDLLNKGKA